jgi:hypothetical protein
VAFLVGIRSFKAIEVTLRSKLVRLWILAWVTVDGLDVAEDPRILWNEVASVDVVLYGCVRDAAKDGNGTLPQDFVDRCSAIGQCFFVLPARHAFWANDLVDFVLRFALLISGAAHRQDKRHHCTARSVHTATDKVSSQVGDLRITQVLLFLLFYKDTGEATLDARCSSLFREAVTVLHILP